MLFDKCADVVLGSPYLLERASLHLPRGISYFLLYLALESHNQLAVKKLVEKWPHGDLTLDFLSQSPLCRRHRCSDARCLEPHEYMGVFGSYTRYSSTEMVASLLEGVFYNYFYSYHGQVGLGLRHLDMSAVLLDAEKISLFLEMVRGIVPATSCHSDSSSDAVISRPHLQNNQPPLSLFVSVILKGSEDIRALNVMCTHSQCLEVKVKGVNALMPSEEDLTIISSHFVGHAHLSDVNGWETYAPDGSLSLWVASSEAYKVPLSCKDLLLLGSKSSHTLANEISALSNQPLSLRSFSLLWQSSGGTATLVTEALVLLLENVSLSLEYLQLQWLSFTSVQLGWIQKCSKLRVLSITSPDDSGSTRPKHSVPEILTTVSQLPLLEFFHWSEGLNLTTHSLSCLHDCLLNEFRKLSHFHVSFSSVLLSTTDLVNDKYSVLKCVLVPLVGLKEGSEAVTTYIFSLEHIKGVILDWLISLRPQVCFKLGKQVSQLHELFRAAQVLIY